MRADKVFWTLGAIGIAIGVGYIFLFVESPGARRYREQLARAAQMDRECELLERNFPVPDKAGRWNKYRCGKIVEWVWMGY